MTEEFKKTAKMMMLIELLLTRDSCTAEYLSNVLNTGKRNVYRYIKYLKREGYIIDKPFWGYYKMRKVPNEYAMMFNVIHLTELQVEHLTEVVSGYDDSNALKASLLPKLAQLNHAAKIVSSSYSPTVSMNLDRLREAIEDHKSVILKNYSSGHSRTVSDRHVEPYEFTPNYTSVMAYDLEKKENRTFRLSRIERVEVQKQYWEHEKEHRTYRSDCFRMTGPLNEHIILELGVMAKNLLMEEFPLAEKDLRNVNGSWILDTRIQALEGAGRFVLGLASEIHIIEGEPLREYVQDYARKYAIHGL